MVYGLFVCLQIQADSECCLDDMKAVHKNDELRDMTREERCFRMQVQILNLWRDTKEKKFRRRGAEWVSSIKDQYMDHCQWESNL